MVRTTAEEFDSLEDSAWWMHEKCMEPADLRAYYGGEKELARARAAADEAEAELPAASPAAPSRPAPESMVQAMSVKNLKDYLTRHGVSHEECVEKSDLQAKALEVARKNPAEAAAGPAWMPNGTACRLCTKPVKEHGGVICRRRRSDGRVDGCGEGVCWRCMKRAPRESFGQVRTTKEEFESLEEEAWWMHEACFDDGDYKDYFGESEPEEFYNRRTGAWKEEWNEEGDAHAPKISSIMQRC